MTVHLHIDPFSGVSGDMLLASLVDAGAPSEAIQEVLAGTVVPGGERVELSFSEVSQHEVTGQRVQIQRGSRRSDAEPSGVAVREALASAPLEEEVRTRALDALDLLVRAEARARRIPEGTVRLRGATEAFVSFLGCSLALDLLGVKDVSCGPLPLGSSGNLGEPGSVLSPTPTTLEILKDTPIVGADLGFEAVTPVGAALVRTLARSFGPPPPMTLGCTGVGFGSLTPPARPHCLRAILGTVQESGGARRPLVLLETNIDDLSAEILATLIEECLNAGALDAWLTPVLMKKGRPAHLFTALCPPARVDEVESVFFDHTSTLGVRRSAVERVSLDRSWEHVETPWGSVRVKVGTRDGRQVNRAPEFEDCRSAAKRAGVPLKEVYAAALKALG